MMATVEYSDEGTITVTVPLRLRHCGGRKRVITPEGTPDWAPPTPRIDSTLVKALARAYRWKNMIESGTFGSVQELAKAERINPSYLARILRLTLLAPAITEAILDGRQHRSITLDMLMKPFAVCWMEQGFGGSNTEV